MERGEKDPFESYTNSFPMVCALIAAWDRFARWNNPITALRKKCSDSNNRAFAGVLLLVTSRNPFGRRKNPSNKGDTRLLPAPRNNSREIDQLLTTNHLFSPNERRKSGFLLPIRLPNPSFLASKGNGRGQEGGGGDQRAATAENAVSIRSHGIFVLKRVPCPIPIALKKNLPRDQRAFAPKGQQNRFSAAFWPLSVVATLFMSIKVATEVWKGSRHRSGNLLVLLALADHADDQGKAWPGIPLLARKARLSERHTRRCLTELVVSGEVEILPNKAPSGRTWYQIHLDQLAPDNLSIGTSASDHRTMVSSGVDTGDRTTRDTYISEPSLKPSEESRSQIKVSHSTPENAKNKCNPKRLDVIGLVSRPKNGF
jgi:helix-turn-helix protein